VLADGAVVRRIMKAAVPVGQSWMWTLAFEHHEDRTPTHGYAAIARGRDGGVRQERAPGEVLRSEAPLSGAKRKSFARSEPYRF
jgi:hypothetical protein